MIRVVTLVGMPGVGKSKIGSEMARMLEYAFIDTDKVISRETGRPIQSVLEEKGIPAFLDYEALVLAQIQCVRSTIVSPGGSSVLRNDGMAHLASLGPIVYLMDTLDNIRARIPNIDTRGIVGMGNDGLEGVFRERDPLYRRWASVTFQIPNGFPFRVTVKEVAQRLIAALGI